MPSEQRSRFTSGGQFIINELIPGYSYEGKLGEKVVFKTFLDLEHQSAHREVPGIIPRIIASFVNVPPFDDVLVLSWFFHGNICAIHGFSFVGVQRDGTVKLASLTTCTHYEGIASSDGHRVRLVLPPQPPTPKHGPIPDEMWVFEQGKLRRTR